jgi:hypothetical protein
VGRTGLLERTDTGTATMAGQGAGPAAGCEGWQGFATGSGDTAATAMGLAYGSST